MGGSCSRGAGQHKWMKDSVLRERRVRGRGVRRAKGMWLNICYHQVVGRRVVVMVPIVPKLFIMLKVLSMSWTFLEQRVVKSPLRPLESKFCNDDSVWKHTRPKFTKLECSLPPDHHCGVLLRRGRGRKYIRLSRINSLQPCFLWSICGMSQPPMQTTLVIS